MLCKIIVCTLSAYINIASGLRATTYGYGEGNCGDIGRPRPCSKGAITSSGEVFDPDVPSAAVYAPTKLNIKPRFILLRVLGGPCVFIRINDKGNPRYIGKRGFDLSPKAVEVLTGKPGHPQWSGKVYVCL